MFKFLLTLIFISPLTFAQDQAFRLTHSPEKGTSYWFEDREYFSLGELKGALLERLNELDPTTGSPVKLPRARGELVDRYFYRGNLLNNESELVTFLSRSYLSLIHDDEMIVAAGESTVRERYRYILIEPDWDEIIDSERKALERARIRLPAAAPGLLPPNDTADIDHGIFLKGGQVISPKEFDRAKIHRLSLKGNFLLRPRFLLLELGRATDPLTQRIPLQGKTFSQIWDRMPDAEGQLGLDPSRTLSLDELRSVFGKLAKVLSTGKRERQTMDNYSVRN